MRKPQEMSEFALAGCIAGVGDDHTFQPAAGVRRAGLIMTFWRPQPRNLGSTPARQR
jgi:hypothetical protein